MSPKHQPAGPMNDTLNASEPRDLLTADREIDLALEGLQSLPRDIGWTLLIAGLLSEIGAPGIPPFWIAGILILWPEKSLRITGPLKKRFPKAFSSSIRMISRFAADLELRYPHKATKSDPSE